MEEEGEHKIEAVRNLIINNSLIIASIVGFITYLVSLTKYFASGFEISFVTDLIAIAAIFFITIKRNSFGVKLKSYVILLGIFLVVIIDVIEIGILSANKILLILIPFFSIISLSTRRAVTYFSITLLAIITVAVLQLSDIIQVTNEDTIGVSAWVINLLMLVLVSVIILLIVRTFDRAYNEFIVELKENNQKLTNSQQELSLYKDDLEELVDIRTEELNRTNVSLEDKTNELSKALHQLREAQEKLIQAEKTEALGHLATGVSHEINNPLNFIHGGLEIAELYLAEHLNEEQRKEIKPALDSIREGVNRSSQVVKGLDHYSRDVTKSEKLDVNTLLTDSIQIASKQVPQQFDLKTSYGDIPHVISKKEELMQIFVCIVKNSFEAMDEPGLLAVSTAKEGNAVVITIKDDGKGIPDENIKKLGNPFFTTKNSSHGVGLGLYMSYKVIRKLNGSIDIESKSEEGTQVFIRLPIQE